jgi:hypothetical protein
MHRSTQVAVLGWQAAVHWRTRIHGRPRMTAPADRGRQRRAFTLLPPLARQSLLGALRPGLK